MPPGRRAMPVAGELLRLELALARRDVLAAGGSLADRPLVGAAP
ncbi:MAG: hypothetical protein H6Q36_236 [Chloroflexi bacterium]|nr:hypothetical protein [Chloroflexota bacterium]